MLAGLIWIAGEAWRFGGMPWGRKPNKNYGPKTVIYLFISGVLCLLSASVHAVPHKKRKST